MSWSAATAVLDIASNTIQLLQLIYVISYQATSFEYLLEKRKW